MIKQKDLYTYTTSQPLSSSGVQIGTTIIQYEVKQYVDVRNLKELKSYIVTCTQRLVIPNRSTYNPVPESQTRFSNYPALITNKINLNMTSNVISMVLIDYFPKTLNTAVSTNIAGSQETGTSNTVQHTTGSSTSQTNSYGSSWNAGFFVEGAVGGYTQDSGNSTTNTTEASQGTSRGISNDSQFSNSSSMSIKDWGSYATIDNQNQVPTWIWGQEYPWDVVQFKSIDSNNNVILPDYIIQRLCIGTTPNLLIAPPTQLSLLGVDFTSKSSWIVAVNENVTDSTVQFTHTLNYVTASHGLDDTQKFTATLNCLTSPIIIQSDAIDLCQLALDPIVSLDFNGAVIGFSSDQYDVKPAKDTSFKILSRANNLLVSGSGFNGPVTTDLMSTDFTNGNVTMDIYFKIIDYNLNYSLFLKCWKMTDVGFDIQINFYDNSGNVITTINKTVDSLESEGGEDNLISIELRNQKYSSLYYHDYLRMGLNHIQLILTPAAASSPCSAVMRALAIG